MCSQYIDYDVWVGESQNMSEVYLRREANSFKWVAVIEGSCRWAINLLITLLASVSNIADSILLILYYRMQLEQWLCAVYFPRCLRTETGSLQSILLSNKTSTLGESAPQLPCQSFCETVQHACGGLISWWSSVNCSNMKGFTSFNCSASIFWYIFYSILPFLWHSTSTLHPWASKNACPTKCTRLLALSLANTSNPRTMLPPMPSTPLELEQLLW